MAKTQTIKNSSHASCEFAGTRHRKAVGGRKMNIGQVLGCQRWENPSCSLRRLGSGATGSRNVRLSSDYDRRWAECRRNYCNRSPQHRHNYHRPSPQSPPLDALSFLPPNIDRTLCRFMQIPRVRRKGDGVESVEVCVGRVERRQEDLNRRETERERDPCKHHTRKKQISRHTVWNGLQ